MSQNSNYIFNIQNRKNPNYLRNNQLDNDSNNNLQQNKNYLSINQINYNDNNVNQNFSKDDNFNQLKKNNFTNNNNFDVQINEQNNDEIYINNQFNNHQYNNNEFNNNQNNYNQLNNNNQNNNNQFNNNINQFKLNQINNNQFMSNSEKFSALQSFLNTQNNNIQNNNNYQNNQMQINNKNNLSDFKEVNSLQNNQNQNFINNCINLIFINGNNMTNIQVNPNDIFQNVINFYQSKINENNNNIIYTFNGRILDPSKSITENGLYNNSQIYLQMKQQIEFAQPSRKNFQPIVLKFVRNNYNNVDKQIYSNQKLKEVIKEYENEISQNVNFDYYYNGNKIDIDLTPEQCNLSNPCDIIVKEKNNQGSDILNIIFINDGQKITIPARSNDLLQNIIIRYLSKIDENDDEYIYIYNNKRLTDRNKTLAQLKLVNNSVINVASSITVIGAFKNN